MNNGVLMLYLGVIADIVTTLIGISLGFTESNRYGLFWVLLVSCIILIGVYLMDKWIIIELEKGYKLTTVTVVLFLCGLFRLYIAILNLRLILTYSG